MFKGIQSVTLFKLF
jgi:hypothetical protein